MKYVNEVRHAPKQRAQLAHEASNLYALLTTLRFRVEDAPTNEPWFYQIKLLAVRERIDFSNKLKDLLWKFKKAEIDEVLGRIECLKSPTNLALTNDLVIPTQSVTSDLSETAQTMNALCLESESQWPSNEANAFDLPKTLDETYERILRMIETNDQLNDAVRILQWLCFAKAPRSLKSLMDVLATDVEGNGRFLVEERLPDPYDIVTIYSSLVAIQEQDAQSIRSFDPILDLEDPIIELAHFSVQEYLLSDRCFSHSFFSTNAGYTLMAEISLIYTLHLCHEALPRDGSQTADGKRNARSDLNLMHATDTDLRRESLTLWPTNLCMFVKIIATLEIQFYSRGMVAAERHGARFDAACFGGSVEIFRALFEADDSLLTKVAPKLLSPVSEGLRYKIAGWRDIELAGEENLADHGQVVRLLLSHCLDEYQGLSYAYDGAHAELLDLL
ncbi:uncharacterized protein Z519_00211 [Cladophialophora bantiana CBS 173.52]|uniref:Prion-inhibition and propagation HeLo domain-containing protein n=1 Tax=Cladophialophora bantiana (strain ATCC 10958 / CBS 173.52 / CDC B-1940 / NIH 8579) TaxID=1442370 RepID=A0A0D2I5N5_CLAB1|nr:uncharacterized protein Z519_00211 [Cladophialophora bantiana CBS 173.52]KIW98550.1 hypothetical protein Z519_00211 [Cladophialophora bantiana CBS 173.52]